MGASDSTKPSYPISPCWRNEEYLTSGEVQRILRCSAKTVRKYLRAGHISAIRVNQRRFLYHSQPVAAFLRSRPAP